MRKVTDKQNVKEIKDFKKRFLKQKQFPPLPRPYEKRIQPILHTGYLMFIRGKFLYLGILKDLEDKNMYSCLSVLKSYWEHVAALGYYYLKISELLKDQKEEEAFLIAVKMGLGGRKFPTEEMIKKKGHKIEEYTLPNIYTMMDTVDKDFKKKMSVNDSMLRDLYDEQIAEGGHTTYSGLMIAGKWSSDRKSQLPDINKSWAREDKSSLLNLIAMSSLIFFFYWDKFKELNKEESK